MALDRTLMANERTLLAYLRTGLGFAAAGASAIHFLESAPVDALGGVLVCVGAVLLVFGAERFRRVRRKLLYEREP